MTRALILLVGACTTPTEVSRQPTISTAHTGPAPLRQVDTLKPTVVEAIHRSSTPGTELSSLRSLDLASPSKQGASFTEVLTALGISPYAFASYHNACASDLAASWSSPWVCGDQMVSPERCPSGGPLEGGASTITALADAGYLNRVSHITVVCLESCAPSEGCGDDPPPPQGQLALDRCAAAVHLLQDLGNKHGRPDLLNNVGLIARHCGTPTDSLMQNATLQSTLFWFEFPSNLQP